MSDANGEGGPVTRPRRVAWIASSTDFGVASIRYRLIYPAVMLQKLGWDNVVTSAPDSLVAKLPELDAIVIVKRLVARTQSGP